MGVDLMYILKCDRCGKEKEIGSLLPMFEKNIDAPKYMISVMGENGIKTITLCSDCEKAFEGFLKNG